MSRIIVFSLILLLLLMPASLLAESGVFINEICWMGTKESSHDEWIELYNNSSTTINLNGWQLKLNEKEIELKGKIEPNSFFILERTDDKTLPEIKADQIYTGSLQNEGEKLELINKDKRLIDKINCKEGWFEGDNKNKRTMERVKGGWQTSSKKGGTPGKENSKGYNKKEEYANLSLANSNFIKFKKIASIILISFITAIFSAIFILLIDKKISKL